MAATWWILFLTLDPRRSAMRSFPSTRRSRRRFAALRLERFEERVVPSFVASLAFDAGNQPRSVAVGDFDGDGLQDLAVAAPIFLGSGGVSVLLSNGDGSFQA